MEEEARDGMDGNPSGRDRAVDGDRNTGAGESCDATGTGGPGAGDASSRDASDSAALEPGAKPKPARGKAAGHGQPRKRKPGKAVMERAQTMSARLAELYPGNKGYLESETPFQLLIAVLLSAQTTDKSVNKVTPELFSRWPDAESMASADPDDVREVIRTVGLANSKSKRCVECAQMILSEFGGEVPRTLDELQRLPGVGRKTANVVQNDAFGIADGVAVDTHVGRVARRMGFTRCEDPGKVEQDILLIFPRNEWPYINKRWIALGREFCNARNPRCAECPLSDICPSSKAR